MAWDKASEEFSLWPDDKVLPTSRDGAFRGMDGQQYFVARDLLEDRPTLIRDYKVQLTEYIRNGGDLVELTSENIEDALQRRAPTLAQKLERLQRSLARRTNYQAGHVRLHQHGTSIEQFPLMRDAGIATREELKSLLEHLSLRNLASYWESSSRAEARITVEGVLEVERMTAPSSESQSAFIAMWFDTQMVPAHHAIERAIIANDYLPDRVDKRDYNHKVDDEIIARVRAARFIVADFTCGQDTVRGGVYFEAGFGLALEKPVIFTVRENNIDRLHFDTRQFNHIVWKNETELEEDLRNRIGRTIGKYRPT